MMNSCDIDKLLNIGMQLSVQRDYSKLFEMIVTQSMEITHADAGTLYILENDLLEFKIMRNNAMSIFLGGNKEEINLPPVPLKNENVCAYVAINKRMVIIDDVYSYGHFDFEGPRKYDALTGYNTRSMMVLPLINNMGEVMGVLQLINCLDEKGQVMPFNSAYEKIMLAIGAQAAICLRNMNYNLEMKNLLNSFVQVMSAAIDERTPYNASHTRNLVNMANTLLNYINIQHELGNTQLYFDETEKEKLVMSAWLHDIGKIVIPLDVMDKPSKLGEKLNDLLKEIDYATALCKLQCFEKSEKRSELEEKLAVLEKIKNNIARLNKAGPISSEDQIFVKGLEEFEYEDINGASKRLFSDEMIQCLLIQRGTLTAEERSVMQKHVEITGRLLLNVGFNSQYADVPKWAADHHELLDGSGYPKGLKSDELPIQTRILTVLDITEALSAKDRPYKDPIPSFMVLKILREMAGDGKIDSHLVDMVEGCGIWKND